MKTLYVPAPRTSTSPPSSPMPQTRRRRRRRSPATPSKKSLFGGGKKKSAKADEEAAAANEREIASRVQAELANQKDWMRQRIASLETALEDAIAFKLEVKKRGARDSRGVERGDRARAARGRRRRCARRGKKSGAFYTLVPIRPRSRGERRSLRTLPGASLRPSLAFNPRHRRLSTPSDAFQLHPDIALYGPRPSAAVKTETTRALQTLRDACAADVNAVVAASMAASDAAVRRARVDAAREAEERKRELGNEENARHSVDAGSPRGRASARSTAGARSPRFRSAARGQMSRTIAMLRHRSVARAMATWRERRRGGGGNEARKTRELRGGGPRRVPREARRAGAFYLTLVPIRPRSRGERRSLRTFFPAHLSAHPLAFNPDTPRRLSTPLLTPLNSTPTSSFVNGKCARRNHV